MAEKILSQEEIDALLNAMDSGEVPLEEEPEDQDAKAEARPYDLTSQSLMRSSSRRAAWSSVAASASIHCTA